MSQNSHENNIGQIKPTPIQQSPAARQRRACTANGEQEGSVRALGRGAHRKVTRCDGSTTYAPGSKNFDENGGQHRRGAPLHQGREGGGGKSTSTTRSRKTKLRKQNRGGAHRQDVDGSRRRARPVGGTHKAGNQPMRGTTKFGRRHAEDNEPYDGHQQRRWQGNKRSKRPHRGAHGHRGTTHGDGKTGAKPENIVYTGPKRKEEHNKTIPEESTTEVAFYNVNNSIPKERIVAILGGGNKIRMVRQTEKLTFVSCWTPGDADLLLRFGLQKLRRAGVSVTTVQRTRFRIDCHNHEIDEGAPCPPYEPYSQQEERHDYGKCFQTQLRP